MTTKKNKQDLANAATKICTSACIAGYNCGKSKGYGFGKVLSLRKENTICPMEQYHPVHQEIQGFFDVVYPTMDDIFLLCKHCKHRNAEADTENEISLENCFMTHCMDCPVLMCSENIAECAAEASCS